MTQFDSAPSLVRSIPNDGERTLASEHGETPIAGAAFDHWRVVRLECLQKRWEVELEQLVRVRPDRAFHLADALEDLAVMVRHVKQQANNSRANGTT